MVHISWPRIILVSDMTLFVLHAQQEHDENVKERIEIDTPVTSRTEVRVMALPAARALTAATAACLQ